MSLVDADSQTLCICSGQLDMNDDPAAFAIDVHIRVRLETAVPRAARQICEKTVELGVKIVMAHARGSFHKV
ncbi:MAG: hypothetical protein NVSMB5_05200 [Candidatus Velthaea sp.]